MEYAVGMLNLPLVFPRTLFSEIIRQTFEKIS
jgi:hypothetical protein